MKRTGLTPKQRDALAFIRSYQEQWRFCPTLVEIGTHMGLSSKSTVHTHIKELEKRGYLQRVGPRAIRVLE